jgi:hypothetical protein
MDGVQTLSSLRVAWYRDRVSVLRGRFVVACRFSFSDACAAASPLRGPSSVLSEFAANSGQMSAPDMCGFRASQLSSPMIGKYEEIRTSSLAVRVAKTHDRWSVISMECCFSSSANMQRLVNDKAYSWRYPASSNIRSCAPTGPIHQVRRKQLLQFLILAESLGCARSRARPASVFVSWLALLRLSPCRRAVRRAASACFSASRDEPCDESLLLRRPVSQSAALIRSTGCHLSTAERVRI